MMPCATASTPLLSGLYVETSLQHTLKPCARRVLVEINTSMLLITQRKWYQRYWQQASIQEAISDASDRLDSYSNTFQVQSRSLSLSIATSSDTFSR